MERAIRDRLAEARPGDGILGEEFGTEGDSTRQWIIDPIDGTANFLRGVPVWGTLIALAVDGVPVVGVASSPAMGRRWWAAAASARGRPRRPASSARARLTATDAASARVPGARQIARLGRRTTRGCLAQLPEPRPVARGRLPRPAAHAVGTGVARPGLRRPVVVRAARRGPHRHHGRVRREALRPRRARADRRGGRRPLHRRSLANPARGTAARSRPTVACTTRCSRCSPTTRRQA